jgi:hypothetical protein
MTNTDAAEVVSAATVPESETPSTRRPKSKRGKTAKADRATTPNENATTPQPESSSSREEVAPPSPPTSGVQGVIEQLRKRILHPDNTVHYEERQRQLNTALRVMDSLSRKISKEEPTQKAMLSGMYELMLVIAERFILLTHGIMQLEMMNRADSLPAIREARRKLRQVADVQSQRQEQEFLDVVGTLKLLSELSRHSLD